MVDFGGWDMPVQYSGIIDEHNTVRNAVGLFDVSHMGEIEIRGPEAGKLTDFVTTNNVAKLKIGQAHYSGLLYEHGGFVDDILVHKVADDHYFLCVNASNQDKDFEHIRSPEPVRRRGGESTATRTRSWPSRVRKARATLQKLTPVDLAAIKYYWFTDGEVSGTPARIAHTGYTGEDGFEIYVPPAEAARLWNWCWRPARSSASSRAAWARATRCGWKPRWRSTATRSTLRSRRSRPTSAGSSSSTRAISWGATRCCKQKESGITRKLVGFRNARPRASAATATKCTSTARRPAGSPAARPSPTLDKNIGLCYLPTAQAQPGETIQIMIRNQPVDAVTVETPFYKRAK